MVVAIRYQKLVALEHTSEDKITQRNLNLIRFYYFDAGRINLKFMFAMHEHSQVEVRYSTT